MNSSISKLVALNPTFETKDGFYSPPQKKSELVDIPIDLTVEKITAQLSALDDSSSFSEEFELQIGNGQYLNILRPQALLAFDLSKVETALEFSNDYGNLCRFLAENTASTDSLKLQRETARATSYRCSDMSNVGIVCADLESVELPKNYYDLIVLSDIETLINDQNEIKVLLARLSEALNDKGVLVFNVQNPRPISDWFKQDQAVPYEGLYATAKNRLLPEQWMSLLAETGLSNSQEYCVLPNGRQPRTILSKNYIESNIGALNHFYGAGFFGSAKVNEYLLFSELSKTRKLYELCDSYLLLAGKKNTQLSEFYNNDFSHFSSPGRKRQWRTLTNKPIDKKIVTKQNLFSEKLDDTTKLANSPNDIEIKQNLAKQPFQNGKSLAGLWLQSLVHENDTTKFEQYLKDYHSWLVANHTDLGDVLYDILPFNLIVDKAGDYQVIDPEWAVEADITTEFVLFRALVWFGFQNRHLLQKVAAEHGLFSMQDFVFWGLQLNGYKSEIEGFIKLETDIQSGIEMEFNRHAIDDTLRLPVVEFDEHEKIVNLRPKARIFFYNNDSGSDYENSLTLTTKNLATLERLNFSLSNLDLNRDRLRIDPVDRGGFFRVSNIALLDSNNQLVWSLTSEREIVNAAELHNVSFSDSHLGGLFIATNDNPQLIFDLSSIKNLPDAMTLTVEMSYRSSIEFIVMQQLNEINSKHQDFNDLQRNKIETLKARYSELNDNFEFLKENSDKQHALIKAITEKSEKESKRANAANEYIKEQQKVIQEQQEMMMRTTSTRLKLFWARKFGEEGEVSEAEKLEVLQEETVKAKEKAAKLKVTKLGQNNDDYALWIKKQKLNEFEIKHIKAEIEAMPLQPKFSIVVPVYNIDEEYLMMAVNSVRNQIYQNWELCLVDDASPDHHVRPMLKRCAAGDDRIVVKLNKDNQGIAGASNDGMSLTTGDYVGLLDHDDEITIDALYENAKVINATPDVDFIYSDEDKVTMDGRRVDPFFKPDYSPDLLDSQNYICHFSVMSQRVVEKIGAFRLGFDGSQDHDIIIRAISNAQRVVHIPKVLYHWRKVPGSTADVYDSKDYAWEAGRKAVQSRLENSGDKGEVVLGPLQGTYQVKRDIIDNPKVSIIIPFKDKPELLKMCIDSIVKLSTYNNYEIIGVSNNSEETATHEQMKLYQQANSNIKFVEKNVPFNFSLLCNYGVQESTGEYVLLLNNDIEIRTKDWIERLLEHAQRDEVGAVGGKLFFPDGRIQHSGVVAGMHKAAGHLHLYFSGDDIGYYGSLMVTRNVSAVTGAMLMVSREKYDQVKGLDEENLAVAYNDVDLCLKLLDQGYRNIVTAFCHAVHYESASRGYEDNPEKVARLEKEKSYFLNKWHELLEQGDPYFNPNFDLDYSDFSIKL